jgi:ribosomal protein L29
MKRRNDFREHLERRRKQAESSPVEAETDAKPASEMTDDELEAALTESRRELLDIRHEELRAHAKEQAGVFESPRQPESSGLAEILRTKNKRPHWRH